MIYLLFAITFDAAFEIGLTPMDKMNVYIPKFWIERTGNKISYYFDLEVELSYKNFFAGGSVTTFAGAPTSETREFVPYKAIYEFFFGYRINKYIEIGGIHECTHHIIPWITFDVPPMWQGAYEKLYIRFSTK